MKPIDQKPSKIPYEPAGKQPTISKQIAAQLFGNKLRLIEWQQNPEKKLYISLREGLTIWLKGEIELKEFLAELFSEEFQQSIDENIKTNYQANKYQELHAQYLSVLQDIDDQGLNALQSFNKIKQELDTSFKQLSGPGILEKDAVNSIAGKIEIDMNKLKIILAMNKTVADIGSENLREIKSGLDKIGRGEKMTYSNVLAKFATINIVQTTNPKAFQELSDVDKDQFKTIAEVLIKGSKKIIVDKKEIVSPIFTEIYEIDLNKLNEMEKDLTRIETKLNVIEQSVIDETSLEVTTPDSLIKQANDLEKNINDIKQRYGSKVTENQKRILDEHLKVLSAIKQEIPIIKTDSNIGEAEKPLIYQDTSKQLQTIEIALKIFR